MDKQNIIIQDNIIQSVINRLSTLREGQEKYNGIALWTKELVIKDIICKREFKDILGAGLDNQDLRSYGKEIRIAPNEPKDDEEEFEVVTKHGKLKVYRVQLLAKITAIIGTLEESDYILDWSHQTHWNIGRGKRPSNMYGVDVDNYIVIKNDEQDNEIRYINEHVSSFHAKILYENGRFYLQAEKGGLKYTGIKHCTDKEWNTLQTDIGVPLYDGDNIKLGSVVHYVLLRFNLC